MEIWDFSEMHAIIEYFEYFLNPNWVKGIFEGMERVFEFKICISGPVFCFSLR